jgi:hypothetical protein
MDAPLSTSSATINRLDALRNAPKFEADGLYSGYLDPTLRVQLESDINALLSRLVAELAAHPTKSFVLAEFAQTLDGVRATDTEDRERFCGYLEEIMDILDIESSDGLLNTWMYGFDPKSAA